MRVFVENLIEYPVWLTDFLLPLAVALLSGGLVALFSYYIVKRHLKKLLAYQRLNSYGFVKIGSVWQTESEVKRMCRKAEIIKVINVSGTNYYRNYKKLFEKAMKNGVEIYTLVADPDSIFLTDIEEMEMKAIRNNKPVRKKGTKIKTEIIELIDEYKYTNLHIRFYHSEYRLPFILAYYKDGSIHSWLNVTLPPQRSEQAMVLRGEKKPDSENETEIDFIDMMESSFDAIWDHSEWSVSKVEEMRQRALGRVGTEQADGTDDPKNQEIAPEEKESNDGKTIMGGGKLEWTTWRE